MKNVLGCLGVLCLAALLGTVDTGHAQSAENSPRAESEVKQTLAAFLTAFDNLDWPAFREFFAPDATMFHPAAPNLKRIDSPQEFEQAWLTVFARLKKASGREKAPYMDLQPQGMKIQLLSQNIALVTFHLLDGNVLSRRTILLRHDTPGWKIVHIHASNVLLSPPQ